MTARSIANSLNPTMASASTNDSLCSDSSTSERHGRSDVMNPILVQQMAQYRMDTFDREAEADHLAALAKGATVRRPFALRERLSRTAGRLRLVLRGSAA
jgi:hypothetical protein